MEEELISTQLGHHAHRLPVQHVHLFRDGRKSWLDGTLFSTRLLWKEDTDDGKDRHQASSTSHDFLEQFTFT